MRQCIYGLLVDVSVHLQLPLLHLLYQHIQRIPLSEYTPTTMTLLRGFAISAISSPHNQKPGGKVWFGMEELWQIMQDGSAVSADMRPNPYLNPYPYPYPYPYPHLNPTPTPTPTPQPQPHPHQVSADMRMMAGTVMQDLLGWQP